MSFRLGTVIYLVFWFHLLWETKNYSLSEGRRLSLLDTGTGVCLWFLLSTTVRRLGFVNTLMSWRQIGFMKSLAARGRQRIELQPEFLIVCFDGFVQLEGHRLE